MNMPPQRPARRAPTSRLRRADATVNVEIDARAVPAGGEGPTVTSTRRLRAICTQRARGCPRGHPPHSPRLLLALSDRCDRRRWASSRASASTRRSSPPAAKARHPSGCCCRRGADLRRARARARRALRPRPPRPRRLPGRHECRQPRRQLRCQALSGGARRVRRQAHAAARDGRSLQRAGGRRRGDHDRL